MRYIAILVVCLSFACVSKAQKFYVPAELTSISQVKVELRSPLSITEINAGYNAVDSSKLAIGLVNQYEEYNLIIYRLINHELIDGFAAAGYSVPFVYAKDRTVQTDSCRYIIRSEYDYETMVVKYYIFDSRTEESSHFYTSVEQLTQALTYGLKFNPAQTALASKSRQELLDEGIFRNVFKERKKMGNGGKYVLGGFVLSLFAAGNVLFLKLDI